jgi:hypothetical protein
MRHLWPVADQIEYAQMQPHRMRQGDYRTWLDTYFAAYTTARMAPRHERLWQWFEALQPGVRPRPRVEVWPRGGAKSTSIELGCARLGSEPEPRRHYVLYVCKTQPQADKHVQAIATMLERVGVQRAENVYGASKGWRHSEVRTANGFNVTAFGLDSGMRGVKLDQFRPDLIVFDDVDDRLDTPETVQKKIEVITTTILPSGSGDCAVIFVQNLIHHDSVVAQLVDGRADFLHDREPATVEPAVIDLAYERVIAADGSVRYVITGGTPTWDGQNLDACAQQINSWGLGAFLREAQHAVDNIEGGLWDRVRDIDPFRVTTIPPLRRIVVAVDPSGTKRGDEVGIVAAGLATEYRGVMTHQPHAYVLDDRSRHGSPQEWASAVVAACNLWRADRLVAESNYGGEMVSYTISTIPGAPPVTLVHASRGKDIRAEPIQAFYQHGQVHHVGVFDALEREMTTWQPGMASPNRMDALVFALTELLIGGGEAWDRSALEALSGKVAV